jgi:hypothetical protein
MKRWPILLLFVVLLFVLTLGVAGVLAKPIVIPPRTSTYRSTLYPCKYDDTLKVEGVEDGIYHVRNSIGISYGASNRPPFEVETEEIMSWNFNLSTGEGYLWGPYTQTYTSENYEDEGLWKGFIAGNIFMSEDGTTPLAAGIGEFFGEGLFEGLRMRSTWSQEVISMAERTKACGFPPDLVNDPPLVKTTVKHFVIGEWPPNN